MAAQVTPPAVSRAKIDFWPHVAMAVFSVASVFTFNIGGNIYGSEIVAAVLLPLVNVRGALASYRALRVITLGYGLCLAGLVMADVFNHTDTFNALRGWANPLLATILTLFFASVLSLAPRTILTYLLFSFIATLIFGSAGYALQGIDTSLSIDAVARDTNMFKIRFIPFLIPAILLVSAIFSGRHLHYVYMLFTIAGLAFFALDARSAGLTLLSSAALVAARAFGVTLSLRTIVVGGAAALALSWLGYIGYVQYSLIERPEGHNATQLGQLENPYNPFELLIQGRADVVGAAYAIADRPITGHGSWASDPSGYYLTEMVRHTRDMSIYERIEANPELGILIPAHSVVLGLWVWGGILGFIGIVIVLVQTLVSARLALARSGPYFGVAAVLLVGVLWDFFFSPIGMIRLSLPPALALLVIMARSYDADVARAGR